MQDRPPSDNLRVGFGTDIHRLVTGEGVKLGGVLIPCTYACVAVSDGDVLLHALIDALLGALALGDIGEHFPHSRVASGEDSRVLLAQILNLVHANNATPVNVDCVVDLEVFKLAEWKPKIRDSIAGLLGIDPGRVNVKAKTAEGLGPVGAGEAIAAQVVALLALGAKNG